MSSSSRPTSKGGKGAKADKSHKSDGGKSGSEKQHSKDTNLKNDEVSTKVKQVMEMTQRSEDIVCYVLHECDYDANRAINMLFEEADSGEWETRVKKKKNRQTSVSKQDKTEETTGAADDWDSNSPATGGGNGGGGGSGEKERGRNKSGGPPRLHGRHNDSRGWRGRERQENERNLEEGGGGRDYGRGDRRGRSGGPTRGGGGNRGRGGGRAGGRYPPRGNRSNSNNTYNKPIDTWDSSNTWDNNTAAATTNHTTEDNWDDFRQDDWEEYTGTLTETKVFTPSTQMAEPIADQSQLSQTTLDQNLSGGSAQQLSQSLQMNQSGGVQMPSLSPVPPMVGTLTAAQSQYFTQLSQQNSDNLNKQYSASAGQTYQNQTYEKTSVQTAYNSGNTTQTYASTQQYGSTPSNTYSNTGYQQVNSNYTSQEQQPTQQPPRAKIPRARVPPPSKIPASAVEMPGDLNSSIGYLDVQFGGMDLIDNSTFESELKYGNTNTTPLENSVNNTSSNLDLNSSTNQSSTLDAYSAKTQTQSSISSALSQSLTNTDNIPQTSEHLGNTYNTSSRSTSQSNATTVSSSVTPSGLELNKQSESHSYSQPSTYSSYQSKANTYSSSPYSTTQVSETTASSYVGITNQSSNYVNNQTGAYSATPTVSSYPNTYSSTTSYQSSSNSGAYPSISQANSYPSSNQSYPQNTSQSVYGGNTGLNNSSNYGSTSTSQYNSYSSANNHKLGKDTSYESSSSSVSSSQAATTNSVSSTSTTLSSLSQTTISNSKTTATLAAKNSNSVVSNIPPGVTPVMSTPYIMGQVPYFQQPVYSYEDMQLLQQRLPHMTTPYFDMSYQTPTTLAPVRGDASLANVGYSISDGRFTRGDNNTSPVPSSTMSQQTSTLTQQGHQAQPILAGTAPPYFFATAFNTIAPNYAQFGTMYTQLPAATNAHGSNNSNQYPKPATYGSGYGSYDALNQTQDYTKGGYVSNAQGQKGAGGNASSAGSAGNDLSAMYGKSHTALGKVNSYEKQGFHSGTPPPFTGALHGSQNAGLAPSGTGYAPQVYIPTMAPHQQHHSTAMMHQPLHQMDVRHQGRRADAGNTSGQRSQASNQAKAGAKQSYQASYWNQN